MASQYLNPLAHLMLRGNLADEGQLVWGTQWLGQRDISFTQLLPNKFAPNLTVSSSLITINI